MKEALVKLSEEQIRFICNECSVTEEELLNKMDDEQVYEQVYEKMCEIEIDEVCNRPDDAEDSERCELASDIVTILGNTLPRYH